MFNKEGDDLAQKRDIEATKSALLKAAKELMTSCNDIDEVTSRAISSHAEVNLAMINYCFGSRETLLYEVFRELLKDAQSRQPELARLMSANMEAKERIIMLHFHMMRLMIANLNYSRAVTKYILLNRSLDNDMDVLPFVKEHFGGRKTDNECRMIAFELTSLHELAVLKYEELKNKCGIDLSDDDELKQFVSKSVERFLESGV